MLYFLLNSFHLYTILLTEFLAVQENLPKCSQLFSFAWLPISIWVPFFIAWRDMRLSFPHSLVPTSPYLPFSVEMIGSPDPRKLSFTRPAAAMWLHCSANGRQSWDFKSLCCMRLAATSLRPTAGLIGALKFCLLVRFDSCHFKVTS